MLQDAAGAAEPRRYVLRAGAALEPGDELALVEEAQGVGGPRPVQIGLAGLALAEHQEERVALEAEEDRLQVVLVDTERDTPLRITPFWGRSWRSPKRVCS
ncbi:hypothetical protein OG936_26470 [Streptomyces sp. NBC_00846]|uniref:hypothetical protein n=1 Tax=Streptomyces sp. NBC_00846 TaxID=2975849 RepID=UPI00386BF0FB|nr:hypothetical protein OG936_26470 [Streptomyces sp. NBC_00846]